MTWPWVSRLAYDAVVAERDRLYGQYDELLANLLRITRHEAGMAETPRKTKDTPIEPMPVELRDFFAGFWDQKLAKMQRAQAYRAHMRGKAWPDVMREAMDDGSPPATGS